MKHTKNIFPFGTVAALYKGIRKRELKMKKFAVYVVANGSDRRVGTVRAYDKGHALTMIPQHHKDAGKIVLVPIVVES